MKILAFAALLILGAAGASGGCDNPRGALGIEDSGTVVGRVIDAKTNAPVNGATVAIGSTLTVATDAQGAFTIGKVPAGPQPITVSAAGYQTVNLTAKVVKDQTTTLDYVKLTPVL